MEQFLRDLRIIRAGTQILQILYFLKTVLTVGIIVFSVLEACGMLSERKNAAGKLTA